MDRFLVFFADPMCSWCYGFGPELDAFVLAHPGLRLDVVMGGLRAGNREAMTPAFRDMLAGHWDPVRQESGLAFTPAALERPGFVYDTEPACRAVVAMRSLAPPKALDYFHRLQSAFYAEGHDITSPAVLAELAEGLGVDRAAFLAAFGGESARTETDLDFSTAREMGVSGFPTLAVGYPSKQFFLLASGFTRAAVLSERLARIDGIAAGGPVTLPHEASPPGDD
ncbi:MAG: DsbA family protein [Betaproteobacteria bacterium]|nr:DsbA family protein [Betaproteobacteria bacterium]